MPLDLPHPNYVTSSNTICSLIILPDVCSLQLGRLLPDSTNHHRLADLLACQYIQFDGKDTHECEAHSNKNHNELHQHRYDTLICRTIEHLVSATESEVLHEHSSASTDTILLIMFPRNTATKGAVERDDCLAVFGKK